ncbi:MAG: hypothetical protein P9M14_02885 [Candidatus Alcyoniella australis]|nr:hypothetical protein [Candidatus Alcyoniella australis]
MLAKAPRRRATLIAVLILAGIFLTGIATGAALVTWLRPSGPPGPPPFAVNGPSGLPQPFASYGLDSDQLRLAQPIVERHRVEVEAAVKEVFPQIHAVREQFDREMQTILTPEQNRRFKEFLASHPPVPDFQGPGLPAGGPLPPPQQAVDSCTGKAVGEDCEFKGMGGESVTGSCQMDGDVLACVPAGGPPTNEKQRP